MCDKCSIDTGRVMRVFSSSIDTPLILHVIGGVVSILAGLCVCFRVLSFVSGIHQRAD